MEIYINYKLNLRTFYGHHFICLHFRLFHQLYFNLDKLSMLETATCVYLYSSRVDEIRENGKHKINYIFYSQLVLTGRDA